MNAFGLIGDKAFFDANRILIDHFFPPEELGPKPLVAPFDDAASAITVASADELGLRHHFWMNPTSRAHGLTGERKKDRVYATLRVDRDAGIISGDLFLDIQRQEWIVSFQSQAVFQLDTPPQYWGIAWEACDWAAQGWHVIAVCNVYSPVGRKRSRDVIAVALRFNGTGRLEAARLFQANSHGIALRDLSMTDETRGSKGYPVYGSFRYLKPLHITDTAAFQDEMYRTIMEQAVGNRDNNVGQEFSRAGTKIFWDTNDETQIEDAGDGTPFELISKYQWSDDPYSYAVLFSSADEESFGTVLELNNEQAPLAKVRFGAIIFLRPIVRRILEQKPWEYWRDHLSEIVAFVRETYIHEVGHLLNLPHTWQRGWFETPAMEGNSADMSIMTYGSRFPLGNFATADRYRRADGKKSVIRQYALDDSIMAKTRALKETRFTPNEVRWLRHAPFDHISPGGPFFNARSTGDLQLGPKGGSSDFELSLELWDTQCDKGVHVLESAVSSDFNRQAIFGEVVLKVTAEAAAKYPFHFAFQAPSLSLLMRAEYPDAALSYQRRMVKEFPVPQLPTNWELHADATETEVNLAQNFHSSCLQHVGIGDDGRLEFRRRLPFVNIPGFIGGFLNGDTLTHFSLQAVLRPVGHSPEIYSELLPIRYQGGFRAYSAAEVAILTDVNLPLYLEASAYLLGAGKIAELVKPDRHDREVFHPVFSELAQKIAALGAAGEVSPTFFAYLKALAYVQADEAEKRTDFPEFVLPDTLLPALRQHLQDDPGLFQIVRDNLLSSR